MALVPVSAPSGSGNVQILPPTTTQRVHLRGWTATEDTGAASAKFQILDAAGGNLLVAVTLAPNESVREFVPPESSPDEGILVQTGGLYLSRVSGTSTVTVYYA